MLRLLKCVQVDETGSTEVEHGLIAVLLGAAIIISAQLVGVAYSDSLGVAVASLGDEAGSGTGR